MRNYSHYEQSLNELSSKRAVSVSVALNANEEERGQQHALMFTTEICISGSK